MCSHDGHGTAMCQERRRVRMWARTAQNYRRGLGQIETLVEMAQGDDQGRARTLRPERQGQSYRGFAAAS